MDLGQLFQQYDANLRRWLRQQKFCNAQLAEEVASRTWALLVARPELLARFDPSRGSFLKYLSLLAHSELRSVRRSAARRRAREQLTASAESQGPDCSLDILEAVAGQLTAAERLFLARVLRCDSLAGYSNANRWQLANRVRQKIRKVGRA